MNTIEHISPQFTLFAMLYGGAVVVSVVLCLYLLLSKGNAIAPAITPPSRLRRWAAAFFGMAALGHLWWYFQLILPGDIRSWAYVACVVLDCVTMLTAISGTMLSMFQDRKRPLWPFVVAMTPIVILGGLQIARPGTDFLTLVFGYTLAIYVCFTIYMVVAVRQYGRWLRDNYADLLRIADFVLFGSLLWRVETLPQLEAVATDKNHATCPLDSSLSRISDLLKDNCEKTGLYLQHDLTLIQLSAAIGVNRSYLSQYFSSQGMNYNTYINGLRINHFVSLYQKAVAARQPVTAQQLASESGYRSYSTFSFAFKQRMGQSVTAWLRGLEAGQPIE